MHWEYKNMCNFGKSTPRGMAKCVGGRFEAVTCAPLVLPPVYISLLHLHSRRYIIQLHVYDRHPTQYGARIDAFMDAETEKPANLDLTQPISPPVVAPSNAHAINIVTTTNTVKVGPIARAGTRRAPPAPPSSTVYAKARHPAVFSRRHRSYHANLLPLNR